MPPTRTTRHILREAGLVEPGGDVADEQVEPVDWLVELRLTLDEIVETARSNRMAAIAGDRRLVPGDRLSREGGDPRRRLDADQFEAMAEPVMAYSLRVT